MRRLVSGIKSCVHIESADEGLVTLVHHVHLTFCPACFGTQVFCLGALCPVFNKTLVVSNTTAQG